MNWLITLSIFWFLGAMFYYCLFAVSKRADKMAETIFTREIMKTHISGSILINEVDQSYEDEKIMEKICFSS